VAPCREESFRVSLRRYFSLLPKLVAPPVRFRRGPNAQDLDAGHTLRSLALAYDWLRGGDWPEAEVGKLDHTLAVQAGPAVVEACTGAPDHGEPWQRGWRMELRSAPATRQSLRRAFILNPATPPRRELSACPRAKCGWRTRRRLRA
jgi:hypothetical protein